MPPRGFEHTAAPYLENAVTSLLSVLYAPPYQPLKPHNTPQPERNAEICARHAERGWSIPKLAREYGISNARVHQILKQRSQESKS